MVRPLRAIQVHRGAVEGERRRRALAHGQPRTTHHAAPRRHTHVLVRRVERPVRVVRPEAVRVRRVAPPLVVHDQRARVVDCAAGAAQHSRRTQSLHGRGVRGISGGAARRRAGGGALVRLYTGMARGVWALVGASALNVSCAQPQSLSLCRVGSCDLKRFAQGKEYQGKTTKERRGKRTVSAESAHARSPAVVEQRRVGRPARGCTRPCTPISVRYEGASRRACRSACRRCQSPRGPDPQLDQHFVDARAAGRGDDVRAAVALLCAASPRAPSAGQAARRGARCAPCWCDAGTARNAARLQCCKAARALPWAVARLR